MKGFLKLKIIDFDAWNNTVTVLANERGVQCEQYTASKPDVNPAYVWARVEHDFIEGELLSEEDAILQGMRVDDGAEIA